MKTCPQCGQEKLNCQLYCDECFDKMVADETIDQMGREIQRQVVRITELEGKAQADYEEYLKVGFSRELENNELRARIAELEAAQDEVCVKLHISDISQIPKIIASMEKRMAEFRKAAGEPEAIAKWHPASDLPPMPERKDAIPPKPVMDEYSTGLRVTDWERDG